MISENDIIQRLRLKSKGYIGDDAAVLPDGLVITKDLLIEDIHFRTQYFNPKDLAHKSLHVNLSDLSAMGAKPLYILCGISIPSNLQEYASDFLDFLTQSCEKENVILIGGDTTSSPDKLFISITALGYAKEPFIKYRSTAGFDESIFVAGNLGWSHIGFFSLDNNLNVNEKYIQHFLRPQAKVNEGLWFAQKDYVTSMMDVSDGLYVDLKRLCEASYCGANIDSLLYGDDFLKACKTINVNHNQVAFCGGEDYALLLTCKKEKSHTLSQQFYEMFHYELLYIGNTTKKMGIHYSGSENSSFKPFTHFGESI